MGTARRHWTRLCIGSRGKNGWVRDISLFQTFYAVSERPRDALCPSVVSLNKIITRAESFIIVTYRLQIYHCVTLSA